VLRKPSISDLLNEWRRAERLWETTPPDDPGYRDAAVAVIEAWLGYHGATEQAAAGSFALIADETQRYVAASEGVRAALDYEPAEVLGLRIEDIAAPELVAATAEQWQEFLAVGRQDGLFRLRRRDGQVVNVRFQARAHFPIAGFHLSRLAVVEDEPLMSRAGGR
jgi:PAS domain-containing protein